MDEIIESLIDDRTGSDIAKYLRDSGFTITEVDEALTRFYFSVVREELTLYISDQQVNTDSSNESLGLGENPSLPQMQMAHRRYPPVTWTE